MNDENLKQNLFLICESINLCMSKKLINPSLILLYSGIDILGWIEYGDSLSSGQRFRNWVESYMLPLPQSNCNSTDLYGARCGLIHTFTPDSDLSKKGKARKILYAWGTSEIHALNEMIDLANLNEYVAVKIEILITAFRNGIESFLANLEKIPEKAQAVYARAANFFTHMSEEEKNVLLNWAKSVLKQP
jgi:hypothetical protein